VQLFHVHVLGQVVALGLQLLPGPPGLLLQVSTADGSRPVRPSASRSATVNATPRLRSGSFSTAGSAGAPTFLLPVMFSFTSMNLRIP